ncbi:MAG: NUDIX hydrolase [Elusimicrobiales bacterium]|nr:NUDIX hydrolase [Elusimicrobiales bacterium]
MSEIQKEHSAGGVVFEDGRVLAIKMRNLKGEEVWTFPKGHLDPGETAEQAALREVLEETGWETEILSDLCTARYSFVRGCAEVDKDVRWFLVKRVGGDGIPKTPDEVLDMRWMTPEEAEREMPYPSDLEILDLLKKM